MSALFLRIYLASLIGITLASLSFIFLPTHEIYWDIAILAISLAIMVFIAVNPIEKRLKAIAKVAQQLAHGNLNVRAKTGSYSGVDFHLSETFNYMAERVESLIRSQQELTNAISHELRTPIARICFELELVAMSTNYEEHDKQLRAIEEDLKELNELIEELLVYARLGTGGPPMRFKATHLEEMIERVINKLRELYPHITYHWNPPADVSLVVVAEVHYLQRAIQNLIANASRYARSTVKINFSKFDKDWLFSVEDDGPGIPVEERERVFSPFARLDDSRTRATGGHGLGLAIVRRIVRWHQGKIWIEDSSSLGGAKLIFSWPQNLS